MPFKNQYSLQKRKYAQISVKKRTILVQLVLQLGKSLAEASRKLNIKPSTAKLIVKKYQQTGLFFMKKLKNAVKNPPKTQIIQNKQVVDVKMEEKNDIQNEQQQNVMQKCPFEQDNPPLYGYTFFPYNYHPMYYKP